MYRAVIALPIAFALLTSAHVSSAVPCQAGASKKSDQAAPADSRQKIVEEINADCAKVVDHLSKSDPGAATRAGQDRILANIDRLLKQQDPSPPRNSSPPASSTPRRPMDEPDPKPGADTPKNQPKPAAPANPQKEPRVKATIGQGPSSIETLKAEMRSEDWAKMPPRMRQAMDGVARERFIRNYEELLRAYYRNIAESSRRKDAD